MKQFILALVSVISLAYAGESATVTTTTVADATSEKPAAEAPKEEIASGDKKDAKDEKTHQTVAVKTEEVNPEGAKTEEVKAETAAADKN